MHIHSVEEARHVLMDGLNSHKGFQERVETRPLVDSLHYVLAENVETKFPIPHFTKSPYDGFAIACPPEGAKGHTFEVIGTIGAGTLFDRPLKNGEALRIMTGAPIPENADTVVMFEQVEEKNASHISVRGNVQKGDNIIYEGEECPSGYMVLTKGTLITAGTIGLLTSLGYESIQVYRKPRVAILTSGKELINVGEELTKATIYNSNGPMLQALLKEEGMETTFFHHVTDDPDKIDEEIHFLAQELAKNKIDILISTGGVSIGDFDFMPHIFESLGATSVYRRISMRPGAAQYGGYSDDILFIGLSGNPSAAFNAFQLIAAPLLRYFKGEKQIFSLPLKCVLHKAIKKGNPVDRYIQGAIQMIEDIPHFIPVVHFTSNAIVGLSMADALYKMRAGKSEASAGEIITVYPLQKRGTK